MKLKLLIPLLVLLAVSSCNQLCDYGTYETKIAALTESLDSCNQAITLTSDSLNLCRDELADNKAGYMDFVNYADSIKLLLESLRFDYVYLEGQLIAKSDLAATLAHLLNQLETEYDILLAMHNDLTENSYPVDKEDVHKKLNAVNMRISVSETAWHQLMSIEPKNEDVLAAMEMTRDNLNTDYGIRQAIGMFFGIQVQSGNVLK